MKTLIFFFKNEETGQGMVEYGFIIALIAIVAMVGIKILGPVVNNMYTNIGSKL